MDRKTKRDLEFKLMTFVKNTGRQRGITTTKEKKYYYSEIFYSIQGEGHYTGYPTLWLRLWACNLQCHGFGQKDPTTKI